MGYVDHNLIRAFAVAEDASPEEVWELLADSASLVFDRACELGGNFFAVTSGTATSKTFPINKTGYYTLPPYISATAPIITFDGTVLTVTEEYRIFEEDDKPSILFAPSLKSDSELPNPNSFTISAKWGFLAIPPDVEQAVIEQAIFMWRRKDLNFAEVSGVSTEAVKQQLCPTCAFVAEKYKEKYFQVYV